MCVGGLVWALDWCPRIHQRPDCDMGVEFIAVAAHPPASSYHKIGAPLTGRGVIQIWCLLNAGVKEQDLIPQVKEKAKKKTKRSEATQPKKPRGRPRKNPNDESVNLDVSNQHVQPLAVQFPQESTKLLGIGEISKDNLDLLSTEEGERNFKSNKPEKPRGRPKKKPAKLLDYLDCSSNPRLKGCQERIKSQVNGTDLPSLSLEGGTSLLNADTSFACGQDPAKAKRSEATQLEATQPKKPRGRPGKNPVDESVNLDVSNQHVQPLDAQFPQESTKLLGIGEISKDNLDLLSTEEGERNFKSNKTEKPRGRPKKKPAKLLDYLDCSSNPRSKGCQKRIKSQLNGTDLPSLSQEGGTSLLNADTSFGCGQDPAKSSENNTNSALLETDPNDCSIAEDVALPRLVMCLAHNGKVAWDVKWRPSDTYARFSHRIGYLAVLLGNGALEVWEVPHPCATKVVFSSCQKEGTDPRFIKLEPVFRCSMLQCGSRQSIPLTLEWSTSSPHDLILAGCHDGAVALWKFSANGPLKDTRPLLCFSADTVPIRALAWAPVPSDPESENIIITAGHKGFKFWDIREPFRPLWDVSSNQRIIYSVDWVPDPRCVVLSFDDGEIKTISLSKAACEVPVTGKPFVGTQYQGSHSYYCSSSSIWSVQVSRPTGMVAYCCSDGTVLRFQLTQKAVEKDPLRNREPHYLCGSLIEEGSALTVFSPLPDVPFPMKKSPTEWGNTPRSKRNFIAMSNQKKAKEHMVQHQTQDEQPLALCYSNDPGMDSEPDDTLAASKFKQTPKRKGVSESCSKEENVMNGEVFPPKAVAMHRVRWNMNKGSERWLCYGGAAGILRCQQI